MFVPAFQATSAQAHEIGRLDRVDLRLPLSAEGNDVNETTAMHGKGMPDACVRDADTEERTTAVAMDGDARLQERRGQQG